LPKQQDTLKQKPKIGGKIAVAGNKLTLICGPSGSGKTTLAKKMVKEGLADVYFEADMWMNRDGEYCFEPKRLGFCHEMCRDQTRAFLRGNKNVIISNTTLTKREALPYIEMAREEGANIEIIHLDQKYQNVHGVSPEKVELMKKKREKFQISDFPLSK
jgi:predicted kinase